MHFSSKVSIGSCRAGKGIVIPHQQPYGMGKYGDGQGMYWTAILAKFKIAEKRMLDIHFCQITMFIKVCLALCFWASDPLINRFFKNLPIKWSEAQKPRPHEFL